MCQVVFLTSGWKNVLFVRKLTVRGWSIVWIFLTWETDLNKQHFLPPPPSFHSHTHLHDAQLLYLGPLFCFMGNLSRYRTVDTSDHWHLELLTRRTIETFRVKHIEWHTHTDFGSHQFWKQQHILTCQPTHIYRIMINAHYITQFSIRDIGMANFKIWQI